jgi:hypothetical protein
MSGLGGICLLRDSCSGDIELACDYFEGGLNSRFWKDIGAAANGLGKEDVFVPLSVDPCLLSNFVAIRSF